MTIPSTGTRLVPTPEPVIRVAARAVDVAKTYGHGEAAVRALDSASVAIPAGRFPGVRR